MAFPDCDAAPDKVDVFKRGCREPAKFGIFMYAVNDNGTLNKVWWQRTLWSCRGHGPWMLRAMLEIARPFKKLGHNVKVSIVALDNGPVPWTGETETFGKAVEEHMRRKLSGL